MLQQQSKTSVLVDASGITFLCDRKTIYRNIPWDALSYGYQASNFKNHQFLILSKEPMTDKLAKSLANRCANRFQMYLDGNLGIYLDPTQDTMPLMEYIAGYIRFPDSAKHNSSGKNA